MKLHGFGYPNRLVLAISRPFSMTRSWPRPPRSRVTSTSCSFLISAATRAAIADLTSQDAQ